MAAGMACRIQAWLCRWHPPGSQDRFGTSRFSRYHAVDWRPCRWCSFEGFHQPTLATYASIRQQAYIALVSGSGFGGSDDCWPYLSGDWSADLYGVQSMPFDGFLFAPHATVAKEAHTSSSVKDLIAAASGVPDLQWEGTYANDR